MKQKGLWGAAAVVLLVSSVFSVSCAKLSDDGLKDALIAQQKFMFEEQNKQSAERVKMVIKEAESAAKAERQEDYNKAVDRTYDKLIESLVQNISPTTSGSNAVTTEYLDDYCDLNFFFNNDNITAYGFKEANAEIAKEAATTHEGEFIYQDEFGVRKTHRFKIAPIDGKKFVFKGGKDGIKENAYKIQSTLKKPEYPTLLNTPRPSIPYEYDDYGEWKDAPKQSDFTGGTEAENKAAYEAALKAYNDAKAQYDKDLQKYNTDKAEDDKKLADYYLAKEKYDIDRKKETKEAEKGLEKKLKELVVLEKITK